MNIETGKRVRKNILSSRKMSKSIKAAIFNELRKFRKKPCLCCIQLGAYSPSNIYINNQIKLCNEFGINFKLVSLPKSTSQSKLLRVIASLNADKSVNAIIVQRPLPGHIDGDIVFSSVNPIKDAECMHPENLGNLIYGRDDFAPCTVMAVMYLLKSIRLKLYGKDVCCVGHSQTVGKPLSIMLLNEFATTAVCHIATSKKKKLKSYVKHADVVISAVGKPNLIKGDWIKKGAVVIDVGISKVKGGIIGDVEFERAVKKAFRITPVPGGVGPLTTLFLVKNTIYLFKKQAKK